MTRLTHSLRALVLALVAGASLLALSGGALADKVHLKDGRVLEGKIVKEADGVIWFNLAGKLEQSQLIARDDIASIERDDPAPDAALAAKAGEAKADAAKGKATRVAFLNFGAPNSWQGKIEDMVGREVSANRWHEAIPLLEKDGVTVVVVRVNSGGGMLLELARFHKVFQEEYKKKFRTVVWNESAISAAAMSPWVIEEMYMLPEGNIGACTGWYGRLQAMKDLPLEQVLFLMEKASENAGRSPYIMRSMQILNAPLSYSIDKDTGDVTWFQDTSGQVVLNDGQHILTLNAPQAVACKFAKGIAATPEELMQVMGITEYEFAGKEATEHIDSGMVKADAVTKNLEEMMFKYRLALQAASQLSGPDNRARRGAEVGRARNFLNQIRASLRVNPNFEMMYGLTAEWFEEQEKILRNLMK